MKTVLLTIGLSVAFFGVGLSATYVALPKVAPDLARKVLGRGAVPTDSTAEAAGEAERGVAVETGEISALAGDLDDLTRRLAAAEARGDSLRRLLDLQVEQADRVRTDATDLASTLTRLEDDELGAVVQKLDGRSFVQLYEASTGRNRSRLLGALTPAQAASFVRHQLPGGRSAPDTTATS